MKALLAILLIVATILCSQGLVSAQYTESARGYMGELYESGIGAYGLMVTAIPRGEDC